MIRKSVVCLFLVVLLGIPAAASGWNATGHRVTAFIAWQTMGPEARAEVSRLLRAHPRYSEDLLAGRSAEFDDPDLWAFTSAAVWPDLLRSPRHPDRRLHRPEWHFVNYPYAPDGDLRGFPEPVGHWVPGQHPENALQAVRMLRHRLSDASVSDAERAIALCWYLHIVGDLHQPLHAVAKVSERFPEGDRGGNAIQITHRGVEQNLHSFWDQRLGGFESPVLLARVAERAVGENPVAALGEASLPAAPEVYAEESLDLAEHWVYLHGHLLSDGELELPTGYDAVAGAIARRRVAQAGYRMGHRLNEIFADIDPLTPPAPPDDGELMRPTAVYATPRGGSYHLPDCRFVQSENRVRLGLEEAVIRGLSPCGVCRPVTIEGQ